MKYGSLKYCPYGQCRMESIVSYANSIDGDIIGYRLFSYNTHVATAWFDDFAYGKIEIYGLYSATTRKHIRAFVNEMQDKLEKCAVPSFYRIPFYEIKICAMSNSKTWLDLRERKAVFMG